ncbi:uncharacterized protein [Nicotiana tomentosiformis]|uniref:uncharacterized protein n=1 Tax=Nicotiana tomentosiformis TaxID=4098 RepID=UPI00388CB9AD
MLKDYDITISYCPGKANVVADALSRKAVSMSSLAYILVSERPLASDVSELNQVLSFTVYRSSLYQRIKECQYDDPYLLVLKDIVQYGDAKKVSVRDDGVLRMQGGICVPNVDGLHLFGLEDSSKGKAVVD